MDEVLLISRFITRSLILLCLWFLCVSAASNSSSLRPKVINIGALFTLNSVIGRAAQPAIQAAIDDVNSSPNILNGVQLKLLVRDTNCSGFIGTMEGGKTMTKKFSARIRKFLPWTVSGSDSAVIPNSIDLREEYANAFRTESYNDFWIRVLAVSHLDFAACISPMDTTTAARLPSYRLFAEHLLDPNQDSVTRILGLTEIRPKVHSLLSDYFSQTANASLLCSHLLKDIDRTRVRYRSFRATFQALEASQSSDESQLSGILARLIEFSDSPNPFTPNASSSSKVRVIQAGCCELLKRLESSRNKARSKLQIRSSLEHGSGIFLVALTASLTIIVASHALALLVAAPGLVAISLELASTRRLLRESAQLDVAAKGTYILNRDLDTISSLVARLNDKLEDMCAMVKFCLAGGEDRLQAIGEVARQLKKNDTNFTEQLDELEEHLYLCFMTINRARNLVVQEILNPYKT